VEREWIVLHTNDVHSDFEAMLRIQTVFSEYTQTYGAHRVLRLDVGDCADRFRPETEGSLGKANVAMMNKMCYDAAVIGNNEGLGFPIDALNDMYAHAAFAVVCANVTSHRARWLRPYVVADKAGLRFGIFGLTAPFVAFYEALGWRVEDPVAVAHRIAAELREVHRVDVVVLLSHLGLPMDEQWATHVPGIDIVLGGHTHHVCDPMMTVDRVSIGAAGKNGSHVGVVRIRLQDDRSPIVQGGVVRTDGVVPDRALTLWWQTQRAQWQHALTRHIGTLHAPIAASAVTESVLGNVLASALRMHCQADVGIVNCGQVLTALNQGALSVGALLACCPSPIHPVRLRVRGHVIREALVRSCDAAHVHGTFRGFGFRGHTLGMLCLDGMHVVCTWDGDHPRTIDAVTVGGELLCDECTYCVATIDMFTFGVGYPSFAHYEDAQFYLPEFLRDVLAQALRSACQEEIVRDAARSRYTRLE
jgi:2',3'-cyclic-nucleotide 2'-phosphodiesterase (5'-nucleotidase family)